MKYTPTHIKGVSDHTINNAFLKTDVQDEANILVIDANLKNETNSITDFDSSYLRLLDRLERLTERVQSQTADIDYVDIRVH